MRLLIVTPWSPFPPRTGGTIVAYNQIVDLAKSHRVHLVCLGNSQPVGDIGEFAEHVEFVPWESGWQPLARARGALSMLCGRPPLVTVHKSRAMRRRVAELMEQQPWDAVLIYEFYAIQYLPAAGLSKAIVNIEDPPSIKLRRMMDLAVWTRGEKVKLAAIAWLTQRYERRILPKMGQVLLLSEEDAKDMREASNHENLGWVGYGVTPAAASDVMAYDSRVEGMVVVSGNMYHPPNVDGILHFLETSFPRVLREIPTAKLWVVGADPDLRICDAAAKFGARVAITGRVDDVSSYLRRAVVSICPVRLKLGVQTKILEALTCGTPVVTTTAGNSGIGGRSGHELWVEDEPAAFAGRVTALLRGESWHRLSRDGATFVADRFSWQRNLSRLEAYLQDLGSARL